MDSSVLDFHRLYRISVGFSNERLQAPLIAIYLFAYTSQINEGAQGNGMHYMF